MNGDTDKGKKDLYRAGMRVDFQKFRDTKKTRQLLLWESLDVTVYT